MKAWRNLNVSFGLINVPVSLTPLFGTTAISGTTVCKEHMQPINKKDHCATCKAAPKETARAYKHNDKLIILPEGAAPIGEAPSKTLKLETFMQLEKIDPVYYNKTYALFPSLKGSAEGFVLLREVLKELQVFAVGSTVLDKSEEAALIRYAEPANGLVMHTLHYTEALRDDSLRQIEGMVSGVNVSDAEIKLGKQLVSASMTQSFDLSRFEDTYYKALQQAIEAPPKKARKAKTTISKVSDLESLLKDMVKETAGA